MAAGIGCKTRILRTPTKQRTDVNQVGPSWVIFKTVGSLSLSPPGARLSETSLPSNTQRDESRCEASQKLALSPIQPCNNAVHNRYGTTLCRGLHSSYNAVPHRHNTILRRDLHSSSNSSVKHKIQPRFSDFLDRPGSNQLLKIGKAGKDGLSSYQEIVEYSFLIQNGSKGKWSIERCCIARN
jgi:hypothetical protein